LLVAGLLIVDLSYWGANLPKIPDGGWFPLLVAAAVFTAMTTWKRGRRILGDRLRERTRPLSQFLRELKAEPLLRVPGTSVYMASNPYGMPSALVHNVEHNKVLHQRVIILTLITQEVPYVPFKERLRVTDLGQDFFRVVGRYGFAQDADVPRLLQRCEMSGAPFDLQQTTFFLGRETLIATNRGGMATWRERLFAFMTRNARGATDFFHIPADRVVEMGAQIEI
jgi:KUP system potassium uptake protein